MEARMNIVRGRVLCPRSGSWRQVEDCTDCAALQEIERLSGREVVMCRPSIADHYAMLSRMVGAEWPEAPCAAP